MDTETHVPFDETLFDFTKFPNQLNYYYFNKDFTNGHRKIKET